MIKCMSGCVRRFAAALLTFCMALSLLTACGKKTEQPEPLPGVSYTNLISDMTRQVLPALSEEMVRASWWGTTGRHISAYGAGAGGTHLLIDIDMENETYTSVKLTLPPLAEDLPGLSTAFEKEEAAAAAGAPMERDIEQGYDVPGRSVINVLETDDRQLYLLLEDKLVHYGLDEAGNTTITVTERALTLCNIGSGGAVQPVARLQLPAEYRLLLSVAEDCLIAPNGTLWITATDFFAGQAHLLCFSMTDGSLLSTLSLPEDVTFDAGDVTLLSDGRLLVMTQQTDLEKSSIISGSTQVYVCDDITADEPRWRAPVDGPAQVFAQGFSGGFVPQLRGLSDSSAREPLISTPEGIFHWDIETGEVQQLLQWTEYAVQYQYLLAAVALPEGRYFVVTQPAGDICIQVLTPLSPEALADRTVLTFGKLGYGFWVGEDTIELAIARFNATSSDYYIKIVDYDKLAQQKGYGMAGSTALADDIAAGDVPDILMLSNGADDLVDKGLTIDLYPYIDADSGLSRDTFLPNVLAACERDGALPSIMAAVSLDTLAVDARNVGGRQSWTWQECQQLCEATGNYALIYNYSKALYIISSLQNSGNLFVDWDSHTAHFDTLAGAQLLQNSAHYPDEQQLGLADPKPDFADGTFLAENVRLYDWSGMLESLYQFGENCAFIGYPGDGSTNGSAINAALQFGISRYCRHPDAAWQLLRTFLLPSFQDTVGATSRTPGFPVRGDSLQRSAQSALQTYGEGVLLAYAYQGNLTEEQKAQYLVTCTRADIDKVLALLESTTAPAGPMDYVCDIFLEEAEAFYNGQRSAEEAAEIIQNRVQTYLDEQG